MSHLELAGNIIGLLERTNDSMKKQGGGLHSRYMQNMRERYEEKLAKRQYYRDNIGQMEQILNNNKPNDGELLMVEARSGIERARIHAWAERNGYLSTRYKTKHFDDNELYHCNDCHFSSYYDECITYDDYGSCFGVFYGHVVKCPCGETWWRYDSTDNGLRKSDTVNAVLIGKSLPAHSKSHIRNRKHPTKKPHDEDYYDVSKLPIRNYKKLLLEGYTHY